MDSDAPSLVYAVVLNYNGRQLNERCLRALLTQDYRNLTILFVDNGSTDDSLQAVQETFRGRIEYLTTGRNLYFAAGANLGMARALDAGARYVLVLNNDVFAKADMVSRLVSHMEKQADCAACQPLLLQAGEASTIASAGVRLCLSGRAWDHLQGAPASQAPTQPAAIAGATGGAMLLCAKTVRATGGFDPAYVMYFEDVDLSLRIRRLGNDIHLVPDSRGMHVGGATTSRHARDYAVQLCETNAYRVIAAHFPMCSFIVGYPACLVVSVLFFLYNLLRLRWGRAVAIFKGAVHGHAAMPGLLFKTAPGLGERRGIKGWIEHSILFPRK